MVSVLGDGVVLSCPGRGGGEATGTNINAQYHEEIPLEYFNWRYADQPRLFVQFGYAEQARSLHLSKQKGTLFQVHLWYYYGDCAATTAPARPPAAAKHAIKKEVFKIYEDLHTYWNTFEIRLRVAKWLHSKIDALVPGTAGAPPLEEWGPEKKCEPAEIKTSLKRCITNTDSVESCLETMAASGVGGAAALCKCLSQSARAQACLGSCWKPASNFETQNRPAGSSDADAAKNPKGTAVNDAATFGKRDAIMQWYNWSPVSDVPMSDFGGGRVDLNIINHLSMDIKLVVYKTFEVGAQPTELGVIRPGQGVRFVSHERERWVVEKVADQARSAEAGVEAVLVREWEVDISRGIVQDFIIK